MLNNELPQNTANLVEYWLKELMLQFMGYGMEETVSKTLALKVIQDKDKWDKTNANYSKGKSSSLSFAYDGIKRGWRVHYIFNNNDLKEHINEGRAIINMLPILYKCMRLVATQQKIPPQETLN